MLIVSMNKYNNFFKCLMGKASIVEYSAGKLRLVDFGPKIWLLQLRQSESIIPNVYD